MRPCLAAVLNRGDKLPVASRVQDRGLDAAFDVTWAIWTLVEQTRFSIRQTLRLDTAAQEEATRAWA